MEALPYYKWHWRDFRANRRVQRMGYVARGLYRELLDEFWSEGHLPNDLAELADICGCPADEFAKHWPEIAPCWVETPNGLVNAKMDAQRTAKDMHRVKMEQAGRSGAIAKMHAAAPSKSSEFAGNFEDELANASESLANASKCHIAEHEHEQSTPQPPLQGGEELRGLSVAGRGGTWEVHKPPKTPRLTRAMRRAAVGIAPPEVGPEMSDEQVAELRARMAAKAVLRAPTADVARYPGGLPRAVG